MDTRTRSDAGPSPLVVPGADEPEARAGKRRRGGRLGAIAVVVGVLVVLSLIAGVLLPGRNARLADDPQRAPAPDFTLPMLDGRTASLSDYFGKPILLNFWASWCGPCFDEAPILADGWARWKDQGVQFLGVNVRDARSWALKFDERFGIEYPSFFDSEGIVERRYGTTGQPESFFIDPTGKIVGKWIGPLDPENLDRLVLLASGRRGG